MPDPTLQATALRYAAGDLTPDEVTAFESRLAHDQDARDALAEAVRLSAAAVGQPTPAPHPSFRTAIRARLGLLAHRGHPVAWAGLGALALAACALVGLALADYSTPPEPAPVAPTTAEIPPAATGEPLADPSPRENPSLAVTEPPGACGDDRSVAEIWADLSNHDQVEKARDEELRWRQRVRDLSNPHHVSASAKAAGTADVPHP